MALVGGAGVSGAGVELPYDSMEVSWFVATSAGAPRIPSRAEKVPATDAPYGRLASGALCIRTQCSGGLDVGVRLPRDSQSTTASSGNNSPSHGL